MKNVGMRVLIICFGVPSHMGLGKWYRCLFQLLNDKNSV